MWRGNAFKKKKKFTEYTHRYAKRYAKYSKHDIYYDT